MTAQTRPSFYDVDQFPLLKELAEKWVIIRDEFRQLQTQVMDINRVDKTHEEVLAEIENYINCGSPYGWVQGWGQGGANKQWIQYGLIVHDAVVPFITNEMPETLNFLEKIKGIKVCALVTMHPQSSLPCHQHPEILDEGLLQMHLPIETAEVNNYAYLNVNGEFRQHTCGEALIFDGSLDHFALNESNKNRTILYLEFNKHQLMR
jgi:aspartyl/asparaginyl beta-hydroxylase (cupin superfamily)